MRHLCPFWTMCPGSGHLCVLPLRPASIVSSGKKTDCLSEKKKQPNQKVGKRPRQTFLQRRHTDG